MTRIRRTRRAFIAATFASSALATIAAAPAAAAPAEAITVPIPLPQIPDRTFSVRNFGAVGDGKALDTASFQKAIDAAVAAGGGVVDVPAGTFLTAALRLGNNVNLHLDKGAILRFTDDRSKFKTKEKGGFEDLLTLDDGHDVAVTGQGTIDGSGASWWADYAKRRPAAGGDAEPPASLPHRPRLVVLTHCQRVLVQGVTLANSPMFHLIPGRCRDVTIDSIHITAPVPSPNTDGIDPSGQNFLITNCTIDTGDDNIAVKPSSLGDDGKADPEHPSVENFTIEHCTFRRGHGMSVGGQTPGGLRHMVVRDCTFEGTEAGIRLKAGRGSGGLVEDVTYENLTMKRVKSAIMITSYYPKAPAAPADDAAQEVTPKTPIWRDIHITNVTAEGGASAGQILGLAEMPVSGVTLTNVKIAAAKPMQIVNAQDVKFVDSQITVDKGPALTVQKATVTGIDFKTGKP